MMTFVPTYHIILGGKWQQCEIVYGNCNLFGYKDVRLILVQ